MRQLGAAPACVPVICLLGLGRGSAPLGRSEARAPWYPLCTLQLFSAGGCGGFSRVGGLPPPGPFHPDLFLGHSQAGASTQSQPGLCTAMVPRRLGKTLPLSKHSPKVWPPFVPLPGAPFSAHSRRRAPLPQGQLCLLLLCPSVPCSAPGFDCGAGLLSTPGRELTRRGWGLWHGDGGLRDGAPARVLGFGHSSLWARCGAALSDAGQTARASCLWNLLE